MRLWDVIAVEAAALCRGRIPLALLLMGMPLGFTVLFGFVYEENVVNHIPLAVYDQDNSSLSRSLVQMFADSERYALVRQVASQEEMQAALAGGEARAALAIPEDFSREMLAGHASEVLLVAASDNNMFGNAAISAAQEIVRSFSLAAAQKLMEGMGLLPPEALAAAYPVRMGVRILGNPANGYTSFMLSGLLLNGLQIGVMMALSPYLAEEAERRRRGERRGPLPLALARAVPYGAFAFLGYLASLAVAVYGFAVPMRGSWWEAALLGGCFLVFVIGALSVFSAAAPTRVLALQAPMLYIMPGLLYSGLSWPAFDMDAWAGAFSLLLPMTYAGDSLRDILLMGHAPALAANCLRMAGYGVLCCLLATGLLAWRLRKAVGMEAPDGAEGGRGA